MRPHPLGHFPVFDLHRLAPQGLQGEKHQVAAVQHGDGQQVQEEEVDAQDPP